MVTKEELLELVRKMPENYFGASQAAHYKPFVAEILYSACCDGVVLAALSRETIADLGYDVSKVDRETLDAIVNDIRGDIDLEALIVSALETLEIPKNEENEDENQRLTKKG